MRQINLVVLDDDQLAITLQRIATVAAASRCRLEHRLPDHATDVDPLAALLAVPTHHRRLAAPPYPAIAPDLGIVVIVSRPARGRVRAHRTDRVALRERVTRAPATDN